MKLSIVVPCYNEEEALTETARRLTAVLDDLQGKGLVSAHSEIVFVDDGSRDATWALIEELSAKTPPIRGVKLARNYGHQNALLAGLFEAKGDAVVSIDADLQDDTAAIETMVIAHRQGADIVYGARHRRLTDSAFKRATAEGYYKLLALLGVNIVFNHADYRLLSRRALAALAEFGESNLFLRGIIPQLGFPSTIVYYDRGERFAGESKYPLKKMLALAWQGITSFSAAPLRMITGLGMVVSFASFGMAGWAAIAHFLMDSTVPGWTSIVVPLAFLGGVQLLSVGIIGEYLAKIYMEVKRRPRFLIDKVLDAPGEIK
jgi:glycosyltransferase involved in cell wall biosynthesis